MEEGEKTMQYTTPYFEADDGRRIELTKSPYLFGSRSDFCDETIAEETVSPLHFECIKDQDGWIVHELNTQIGIAVNGEALTGGGRRPLAEGTAIDVAGRRFVFHAMGQLITEDEMAILNQLADRLDENPKDREAYKRGMGILKQKAVQFKALASASGRVRPRAEQPARPRLFEREIADVQVDAGPKPADQNAARADQVCFMVPTNDAHSNAICCHPEDAPYLIGSGASCAFQIEGGGVGGVHAAIHLDENGHFLLVDRGTLNGTAINGQILKPGVPYRLHVNDAVIFGQKSFKVTKV